MEDTKLEGSNGNGSSTLEGVERITRSNTRQSGFLKLPAELRHRTYELVFAGHTIHIASRHTNLINWKSSPNPRSRLINLRDHYSHLSGYVELDHVICQFPDLETDIYAQTIQATDASDFDTLATKTYSNKHVSCHQESYRLNLALTAIRKQDQAASIRTRLEHDQLPLHVLSTCRQIWIDLRREIHKLVYSGNTFSFHRLPDLDLFLRSLAPSRRQLVRSINLHNMGRVDRDSFKSIMIAVEEGYMPSLADFSLVIVHAGESPQLSRNPFGPRPPKNVRVLFVKESLRMRPEAERLERLFMRADQEESSHV